jgi:hypothetical protein
MKLQVAAGVVALALAAGGAAAQGTFNPGGHASRMPATPGYHPTYPAAGAPDEEEGSAGARRPSSNGMGRIAPMPEVSGGKPFKPYETPKYGSPYASPPAAAHGARNCELSVFANACGKH